jgi:glycine/D-amino acid oxidase-like deaminating enzyme
MELVGRVPVDFYDFGRALRFFNQAQFHPIKYLNGLVAAVRRLGGGCIATPTPLVLQTEILRTFLPEAGRESMRMRSWLRPIRR